MTASARSPDSGSDSAPDPAAEAAGGSQASLGGSYTASISGPGPDPLASRTTGRVEHDPARDQDFRFDSPDTESGRAATRPVSATKQVARVDLEPKRLARMRAAALAASRCQRVGVT
jgi:hypothetical protein